MKMPTLENAETIRIKANVLRYFKGEHLLTVSTPDYFDPKTGTVRSGRGIGLDLAELRKSPAQLRRLIEILSSYLVE